ncbi:GspH/FimT family pseudopilin [Desulfobulbus sp. US2]|nr:GspH/FimT family pseudopilin [Desulfobulbus sp. US4]MCW5207224.1 GspH/FimT family pseudopilin [Desulfobulbus sp. US2]MCW5210375.1 GspH/FimT family pseudopilin [Desulfobulbus sp. N3]
MKQEACRRKEVYGFSLVELILVIALLGVLSAVVVPSVLKNLPELRLKNAARNLHADLQKARLLAVKENRKVTVRFHEAGGYYYIDEDEKGTTGHKEWNPDEMKADLADYGGVIYGQGSAAKNWNNDLISRVVPYQDISFKTTGTATPASIYLQYQNENGIIYAVTTTSYGTVKVRRFSGLSWE